MKMLLQSISPAQEFINKNLSEQPKTNRERHQLAKAYFELALEHSEKQPKIARMHINSAIAYLQKNLQNRRSKPTRTNVHLLVKAYQTRCRLLRKEGNLKTSAQDLVQIIQLIAHHEPSPYSKDFVDLSLQQVDAIIEHALIVQHQSMRQANMSALNYSNFMHFNTKYVIEVLDFLSMLYPNRLNSEKIHGQLGFVALLLASVYTAPDSPDFDLEKAEKKIHLAILYSNNLKNFSAVQNKIQLFRLSMQAFATLYRTQHQQHIHPTESFETLAKIYSLLFSCFPEQNSELPVVSWDDLLASLEFITSDIDFSLEHPHIFRDLSTAIDLIQFCIQEDIPVVHPKLKAEYLDFHLAEYLNTSLVFLLSVYQTLHVEHYESLFLDEMTNSFSVIYEGLQLEKIHFNFKIQQTIHKVPTIWPLVHS